MSGAMAIAIQNSPGSAISDSQTYDYRGKEFAAQSAFCNAGDTSYPGSKCATTLPTGTSQTVQIDRGTYDATSTSWTTTASGQFVRATVSQRQPAYLAKVLGLSTVNIPATAVAQVTEPKETCILGLGPSSNALTIGGSSTITGNGCALMSNNTVKYNSAPNFSGSGWAIDAVGGCIASSAHCNASVPYNYNMLPATNPLQVLNTESFNTRTGSTKPCSGKCGTVTLSPNSTGAYGNLTVTTGDNVTFSQGTYFFYNAAIKINGGTVNSTGVGVTLVLLGDSSLSINGGTVNLYAPTTNPTSSDLNGVLIDDQAPNKSNNNVTVNGGGSVNLGGAMYFPNVAVSWGGTAQNAHTTCSEVIANTLTINGNAYLSTQNCVPSTIGHTQVVVLVQ
jgi:hypothetical protein